MTRNRLGTLAATALVAAGIAATGAGGGAYAAEAPVWTPTPLPDPGFAFGVADLQTTSGNEAWGTVGSGPEGGGEAAIAHWRQGAWTYSPVPDGYTELGGLDVVGRDDMWTVGKAGTEVLASHWDGEAWTSMRPPMPTADDNDVTTTDVLATGPDDVWIEGGFGRLVDGRRHTFVYTAHWDGESWDLAELPRPEGARKTFTGRLTGTDDGTVYLDWTALVDGSAVPKLSRNDGSGWTEVALPDLGGGSGYITSVAPDAEGTGIWVAGHTWSTEPTPFPFLRHFDGAEWTAVELPHKPLYVSDLAVNKHAVIVVGDRDPLGAYEPKALRYDGRIVTALDLPAEPGDLTTYDEVEFAPHGDRLWLIGMVHQRNGAPEYGLAAYTHLGR